MEWEIRRAHQEDYFVLYVPFCGKSVCVSLWLICVLAQKCHSGGIRAPAIVVLQPTAPVPGLVAVVTFDVEARDVYVLRPPRCSVYRASHNPN